MRVLWVEHPDGAGPGVFDADAEMVRWRAFAEPPPEDDADAIVLFGASTNVVDAPRLPWLEAELDWLAERVADGTPVLGVCFGAQLVARVLGAEVTRAEPPEIGWFDVELTDEGRADPVLGALPERFCALQWHSWQCALPDRAVALARSPVCLQAFRRDRVWGVQFHPETDEPTLHRWIAEHRNDPDAVAQGFAPSVALAEAGERLPAWQALGRRLFAAWAKAAAP